MLNLRATEILAYVSSCSKAASFMKKCVEAYEIAGCVQYQYQPKIPIQEHHHTASVAMGLLANKED